MAKNIKEINNSLKYEAWAFDQISKSIFFHQKLHEWELLEVAEKIENIKAENLSWNKKLLGITDGAWDKVIHRGIKPITVFANSEVLSSVKGAVAYYRMLSMVSQKSMGQIGKSITKFEKEKKLPNTEDANALAFHFNHIISQLIESDENLNAKEFDLWRGMAAGSQAQGSWQNAKGNKVEIIIRGEIEKRLKEKDFIKKESKNYFILKDDRKLSFSSEPDIFIEQNKVIEIAIEVKGGIDLAGVLERVGAAIKSLRRAKEENPKAITILIMHAVSFSNKAEQDLKLSNKIIDYIFMIEDILEKQTIRDELFKMLRI